MPDEQIRRIAREATPTSTNEEIERLIEYVHHRRDNHPYFLDSDQADGTRHEIIQISTGTNYEQAKLISLHSDSYVMTDLRVRWREIELDRADSGIDPKEWSPFAKAFQGLPFHFLDSVPLTAALALRKEGRLAPMRSFLRKTWNATAKTNPFDESNIPDLTAQLEQKVREAQVEWKKIDQDLVKIVTAEALAGLLAAGPLVAAGHAHWVGAAVVAAGVGNLVAT